MSFENANEIIPGFWIGNYKSAHNLDFLHKNNINVIVNCTPDIPFINELVDPELMMILGKIDLYRLSVYDSLMERDIKLMELYFSFILPYLHQKYITENKNVLVHCRAGKMRSGVVGLSFLYFICNYTNKSKWAHPNTKRVECQKIGKTESSITSYLLTKRPKIFGYGLRNNFRQSFRRFFRV